MFLNRPRVLLADDHLMMREKVTRMLESEFDIIGAVTNGQALLKEATELDPDIVILDITMPGLSGIETARRLRETGSHAKIVFLTVHEDPDFIREALATGALGYVVKPRLASDLLVAMREALEGRSFVSPSV